MATSQKLREHFLTCSVCFEVFTNPSTLACGHTFCGQCLVKFTKTRPDAIKSQSLPCPFCRKLTKVPDPHQPVEKWAEQMKPIFLLKGLIDSFGPGSKEIINKLPNTTNCNLCHDEGETTPAAAWCSVCDVSLCNSCLKAHRRIPATRHHDVSDLSGEVKVARKRKIICHEHKDEYIKFYCKDCRKSLCQSCCIVYHRQCKSVETLESMLPEIKANLEARQDFLLKKIHDEETQLVSRNSLCSSEQQRKSSIQSQIRCTAQKAMDAIKKKEKQLMDELDEITNKQMGQLIADIKSGDMAIQIYKQQSEFIDQALNSDSEVDMYDLYQSCESGTVESVGDTEVKDRGTRTRIEFSQDINKMNKALDELSLGKITQYHEDMFRTSTKHLSLPSIPTLNNTIDCRIPSDEVNSFLNDVTYMSVDGSDVIIVTDGNNKCVKSFYSRNNHSVHSCLQLQRCPIRIARVDVDKVAVTNHEQNIVTIKVSPDLSLLSSITTRKQYFGLTALTPTTMAAGSHSPPCVDILDRSGNVLQFISPLNNGQKIIKYPNFLCTTMKGNILVSDCGTKSVLCLTPQGDVVFNYSPTGDTAQKNPTGITSTITGDILVVDNRGHKVIQLSESGQFVRDILTSRDGLSYPWGLDYSEKGNIYVTKNNKVMVFTFQ